MLAQNNEKNVEVDLQEDSCLAVTLCLDALGEKERREDLGRFFDPSLGDVALPSRPWDFSSFVLNAHLKFECRSTPQQPPPS